MELSGGPPSTRQDEKTDRDDPIATLCLTKRKKPGRSIWILKREVVTMVNDHFAQTCTIKKEGLCEEV